MFRSLYVRRMKRKHGKPMSFAQATKKELRDAFGPNWIAHATHWIMVVGCLALAASVMASTLDIAGSISETLENLK